MIRHLVNLFLWALPPTRLFSFRRACLRAAGVTLGEGTCVCGRGWIYGRGKVEIGAGSWLSPGAVIFSHLEAPVRIGARCDIGPGVTFVTGSHEIGDASRRAGKGTALPVTVGDGCWIGAGALVLGGVEIGASSVVAAGAVVTRDVAESTLAAGVPAMPKKSLR
jgi:maltose O-acetyltransferase